MSFLPYISLVAQKSGKDPASVWGFFCFWKSLPFPLYLYSKFEIGYRANWSRFLLHNPQNMSKSLHHVKCWIRPSNPYSQTISTPHVWTSTCMEVMGSAFGQDISLGPTSCSWGAAAGGGGWAEPQRAQRQPCSLQSSRAQRKLAAASQVTVLKLFQSAKLWSNTLYNNHVLK